MQRINQCNSTYRADAVTDLDEGAAPSDPTQGPAEGQDGAGSQAGQEGAAEQKEAEDPSAFLRQEGETADAYARRIFERVYGHDIERVLRMEVSISHAQRCETVGMHTHPTKPYCIVEHHQSSALGLHVSYLRGKSSKLSVGNSQKSEGNL